MKRLIAILVLSIYSTLSICAKDNQGSGSLTEHRFKYKGLEYKYHLYLPQNITDGAPLVMVFHGYGSKNIPSINYGFHPVADNFGFAVCYPCGPADYKGKNYWSVGYQFHIENGNERDDVGFAVALVKHLQRKHNLSKRNVFATGHSNGGAMSYLLAYKAAKTFAAVAPVSGHIMQCVYNSHTPKRPIPLMEVHGTKDHLSRWNGDPYNQDGWGADIAIPCAVGIWRAANRCTHEVTDTLPRRRNTVIAHRYVNGINGNQVWFYEVVGGKHSWAEADLDTSAEIWTFFSLYIK